MKIALCHHYSLTYFAGGEKWLISLAKFLESRGHKVSIYNLPFNRKRKLAPLVARPYREAWRHSVDADVAYFVYAPLVWRLFEVNCPKIAGLHSFVVDTTGSSDRLTSLPLWRSIRYLGLKSSIAIRYFKHAQSSEFSCFDAVHTLSKLSEISHPNRFHIPSFVDNEIYRPTSEKKGVFTVLFSGRRDWTKGIDTFVEIARLLPLNCYRFETVGAASKSTGIHDNGLMSGEALVRAYGEAHCLVHPSRADVFPLSILESLACGTPVITTPLPSHQCLGLPLLYGQTAEEIANQVKMLRELWLHNQLDYARLCQQARTATAAYDVGAIGPMYERMLESVGG